MFMEVRDVSVHDFRFQEMKLGSNDWFLTIESQQMKSFVKIHYITGW